MAHQAPLHNVGVCHYVTLLVPAPGPSKLVSCYTGQHPVSSLQLLPPRNIVWGHASMLGADLACLEHLLAAPRPWHYYLNLAGSEYPIMTNHQLIQRLLAVCSQ